MSAKHDPSTTGTTAVWHECYCRWYDHRKAGHGLRAAAWGWLADRVVGWTR